MLKQTSDKFKAFFLLQFTNELIKNYEPFEIIKSKIGLNEKNSEVISNKKDTKEIISNLVKSKEKELDLNLKNKKFLKKIQNPTDSLREKINFPSKTIQKPTMPIKQPFQEVIQKPPIQNPFQEFFKQSSIQVKKQPFQEVIQKQTMPIKQPQEVIQKQTMPIKQPQEVIQKPPIQKPISFLRIPTPRLPPRFQYLKPHPQNLSIDLGKLNPLIQNPTIKVIECPGPDQNIQIREGSSVRKINIVLNKDELMQILETFSQAAKIPLHEGIFRVVVGRLVLNAMISKIINTKFIIEKMNLYSPHKPQGSMLIPR